MIGAMCDTKKHGTCQYFKGVLDEVMLFNVVLTAEEIQQIMEPAAVESEGKLTTTWGEIKQLF